MNKNRLGGANVGPASRALPSPYPSKSRTGSVDPAIARGRRLVLPQETLASVADLSSCRDNTTEGVERQTDRAAEVSRGHSRFDSGLKARTLRFSAFALAHWSGE